jgi:hypothetical protein
MWSYFEPDTTKKFEINTFDDGNQKYKIYTNTWYIFGRWLGKIALVNSTDDNIRILSISEWKVTSIS